ncbi:MAG: hypothetical protein ACYDB0_00735 [Acidithiobacillus sp.]
MFRNAEDYANPRTEPTEPNAPNLRHLEENARALSSLIDQYLDRLDLSIVQREWVVARITDTCQSAKSTNVADRRTPCSPFAALQQALADLSDGDELQTRLAMALPATRQVETRPDVWLRHHQAPKIHRASMASKPFLRTPRAALLACVHRRPATERSVQTGRLGWLTKAVVACGVVLMGSLAVPAFAHAGDAPTLLNNQYETRAAPLSPGSDQMPTRKATL